VVSIDGKSIGSGEPGVLTRKLRACYKERVIAEAESQNN